MVLVRPVSKAESCFAAEIERVELVISLELALGNACSTSKVSLEDVKVFQHLFHQGEPSDPSPYHLGLDLGLGLG